MELLEAIQSRHSYRGEFTNETVPETDLRKIVQAGIDAPTGGNRQTVWFLIANEAEICAKISRIVPNPMTRTAQANIAVLVEPGRDYAPGVNFHKEDAAAAVENILLTITGLGYASCWLQGALLAEKRKQELGTLFNLPEGREILVLLPLGKPVTSNQAAPKAAFEARVQWNKY